jgi:hypothetical protein
LDRVLTAHQPLACDSHVDAAHIQALIYYDQKFEQIGCAKRLVSMASIALLSESGDVDAVNENKTREKLLQLQTLTRDKRTMDRLLLVLYYRFVYK